MIRQAPVAAKRSGGPDERASVADIPCPRHEAQYSPPRPREIFRQDCGRFAARPSSPVPAGRNGPTASSGDRGRGRSGRRRRRARSGSVPCRHLAVGALPIRPPAIRLPDGLPRRPRTGGANALWQVCRHRKNRSRADFSSRSRRIGSPIASAAARLAAPFGVRSFRRPGGCRRVPCASALRMKVRVR